MISWLGLALAASKFLVWVSQKVSEEDWKESGRQEQLNENLQAASAAAGIARQIDAEVGGMSDAEVDQGLEEDYRRG